LPIFSFQPTFQNRFAFPRPSASNSSSLTFGDVAEINSVNPFVVELIFASRRRHVALHQRGAKQWTKSSPKTNASSAVAGSQPIDLQAEASIFPLTPLTASCLSLSTTFALRANGRIRRGKLP